MIGSCTLVVKDKNGSYRVHIVGGIVLGEVGVAELTKLDKKYKEKPDAAGLSESDVYKILSSHQCASENQPHYSKFAGDRKWFLDLSTKSLIDVDEYVKNWETIHKTNLEEENRQREQALKEKTKKLLKEVKANAKVFARELLAVMENKSKLQPTDEGHRGLSKIKFEINHFSFSQWATDRSRVQFFAPAYSEDRDIISKHFDFNEDFFPKFLKKSGYEVTVMKTRDWQNKPMVSAFFAKKDGRTIHWNHRMECDLSLVKLETI